MVAIPVGSDPDWLFCHIRGWAVNSIRVRVSVHNAGIPEPDRVPQGRARRRQAAGVVRKQPPAEHTSGLSGSSRLDVDSARAAALRAELDRPLRYRPERDRRVSLAAPAALGRRVPYTRPVNWAGGPGAAPHPASGGLDRWCHVPRRCRCPPVHAHPLLHELSRVLPAAVQPPVTVRYGLQHGRHLIPALRTHESSPTPSRAWSARPKHSFAL